MSYCEFVVELVCEYVEVLFDVLFDFGVLLVFVEDVDVDMFDEQLFFGELGLVFDCIVWQYLCVVVLLLVDYELVVLFVVVVNEIGFVEMLQFVVCEVEEQDWVWFMQLQFELILIGEWIWVVLLWYDVFDFDVFVFEFDFGFVFGIGSYFIICLCMEWFEQLVKFGQLVFDYGCGLGIFVIFVKKCGVNFVIGIDIDLQVVELVCQNSECNCVEVMYGLFDVCLDGEFDIVVVNILLNLLKLMVLMFVLKVKLGGCIVLLGVFVCQVDEVVVVYVCYVDILVWCEYEGWVCFVGICCESYQNSVVFYFGQQVVWFDMFFVMCCFYCEIVFWLQQEQFVLYQGFVCCGYCYEVFNVFELFVFEYVQQFELVLIELVVVLSDSEVQLQVVLVWLFVVDVLFFGLLIGIDYKLEGWDMWVLWFDVGVDLLLQYSVEIVCIELLILVVFLFMEVGVVYLLGMFVLFVFLLVELDLLSVVE